MKDIIVNSILNTLGNCEVEVINDSELHKGHGGYDKSGNSHFRVIVKSNVFAGKSKLEQQKMVMNCLGHLMDSNQTKPPVHSISIKTIVT